MRAQPVIVVASRPVGRPGHRSVRPLGRALAALARLTEPWPWGRRALLPLLLSLAAFVAGRRTVCRAPASRPTALRAGLPSPWLACAPPPADPFPEWSDDDRPVRAAAKPSDRREADRAGPALEQTDPDAYLDDEGDNGRDEGDIEGYDGKADLARAIEENDELRPGGYTQPDDGSGDEAASQPEDGAATEGAEALVLGEDEFPDEEVTGRAPDPPAAVPDFPLLAAMLLPPAGPGGGATTSASTATVTDAPAGGTDGTEDGSGVAPAAGSGAAGDGTSPGGTTDFAAAAPAAATTARIAGLLRALPPPERRLLVRLVCPPQPPSRPTSHPPPRPPTFASDETPRSEPPSPPMTKPGPPVQSDPCEALRQAAAPDPTRPPSEAARRRRARRR